MATKSGDGGKRSADFGQRPTGGWLHDDAALTAGAEGIFYSFPVFYCGSIELRESLRGLDMQEQILLTRELISVVAEKSGARKASDRVADESIRGKYKNYINGNITIGQVEVTFCISSTTLAIGPPQDVANALGGTLNSFFAMHDMRTVSLAAGGELRDYELVAYVAKDSSGMRECFVFDCAALCDEVLTTISQAFVLAHQTKTKAAQATIDDNIDALYEKTEKLVEAPTAAKPADKNDKKKAIVQGLNKLDVQRRSVRAAPALKPAQPVVKTQDLTPTELEQLKLRDAEEAQRHRPSWVSQGDTIQRISLDDLRKQFLSQAKQEEIIEVEED